MPLPKPKKGEKEQEYISRCIQFVKHEDPKISNEQASAMCYTTWRNRNKKREMRRLSAKIEFKNPEIQQTWLNKLDELMNELKQNNRKLLELPRSTLIVGNGTYNGEYFPAEEIEKSYHTLEKQPYINDHSDKIRDEVGWWTDVQYDKETFKMSGVPVLNMDVPEATTAFHYIRNRALAGTVAELSAGVFVTPVEEPLSKDSKETHIVCRDLSFDHGSNVSRGACSPTDGAGIGLTDNGDEPTDPNIDIEIERKNILKQIYKEKIKAEKLKMEEITNVK